MVLCYRSADVDDGSAPGSAPSSGCPTSASRRCSTASSASAWRRSRRSRRPRATASSGVARDRAPATPERAQIAYVDTPGVQRGTRRAAPLHARRRRWPRPASATSCCCWSTPPSAERAARRARARARPTRMRARRGARAGARGPRAQQGRSRRPSPSCCRSSRRGRGSPPGAEVVPISARDRRRRRRCSSARSRQRLPAGPALFPEEMVTDRAERFLAGELIREQLYHQLGKELPYACRGVRSRRSRSAERGDVVDRRRDRRRARLAEGDRRRQGRRSGSRSSASPRAQAIAELLGMPGAPRAVRQGRARLEPRRRAGIRGSATEATRHDDRAAGRHRRPAQRRQVDPVQPPGRRPPGARPRHARPDPRPPLRRGRLLRRRAPRRRHRRPRSRGRDAR